MDQQQILRMFPDIEYEEVVVIMNTIKGMTEPQQQQFLSLYDRRRKNRNELLLFTLLGFVGIAGIHRFIVGDIALGILYFFTGGLCFIGTIVDLININSLVSRYNTKQAYEVAGLVTHVYKIQ